MTTIYSGSNYGIISTNNSGAGTLAALSATAFGYELAKNYTAGTILIKIDTPGLATLTIYHSNDISGTIYSTDIYKFVNAVTKTIEFKPTGQYYKVELKNDSASLSLPYTIQTRLNNSNDPTTSEGTMSPMNSFKVDSLLATATLQGEFEDISNLSLITFLINCTSASATDPSGVIQGIFSMDGINEDRLVSYTVQDITANGDPAATNKSLTFNPAHTLLPIARYFKIRFINGGATLTNLRISTIYHTQKSKALTSRVTQNLTDQFDSDTTRSILVGRTLGTTLPQGHYQNIGVQNQSIAAYIREPSTAFGEVLSADLTPLIQYDFSNGEPYEVMAPIYMNNLTYCSYIYDNAFLNLSVSGINSIIQSSSSEYIKYKAGQGIDMRMTGVFDTNHPIGSSQSLGLYTPENELTFGYFDIPGSAPPRNTFCIRYGRGGKQQIINITVGGTTTSSGTITINFGTDTVSIAILSGTSAKDVAALITNAINTQLNLNIYGWSALYITNNGGLTYIIQVIRKYAAIDVAPLSVTPSLGLTTLSIATLRSGVSTTYEYIEQSAWNIDKCYDQGSLQSNYLYNPSGFILDPTKGNVYRINMQYLGFGAITFYVENTQTGTFMPVHQIRYANTHTVTSLTSPNFKLTYTVENTISSTPITLRASGISAFTQGKVVPAPLYRAYANFVTGNYALSITKPNSRVIFGFRVLAAKTSIGYSGGPTTSVTINRGNLFLNSISAAFNSSSSTGSASVIVQLVKNPTGFFLGEGTGTIYYPPWREYERDSTIKIFDGTPTTSGSPTTTGITYTGGVNVFDVPLVDNTTALFDLNSLLINASVDEIYVLSVYGQMDTAAKPYDISASISYQINN